MTVHANVQVGQVWRCSDPRDNIRLVRVVAITNDGERVEVENLVTHKRTRIRRDRFCTGTHGWSLEKDAA